MRDRIIERHKRGQGYRKICKEMNLTPSTVGNIIRKYEKYGDGTANLPRNGRPRKINERTSRWIRRNVQINPFITRSEIETDLESAGIFTKKVLFKEKWSGGLKKQRKEGFLVVLAMLMKKDPIISIRKMPLD